MRRHSNCPRLSEPGPVPTPKLLDQRQQAAVVHADDAVQHEGVWRTLTRSLRTRALAIQSPEQVLSRDFL